MGTQRPGRMAQDTVPQPTVFRNGEFALVHYATSPVLYDCFQSVLKSVPKSVTSEVALYEHKNSKSS